MKKLILLLMCICMVGCKSSADTSSAAASTLAAASSETTSAETTFVETTSVEATSSEATSAAETAESEETVAPEVTEKEETAVSEVTETVSETETTTAETAAETTTEETTVSVTTAETTTAATTTTTAATTTETTAAPVETTAVPEEDHSVIEIEGKKYKLTFEDEFEGDSLDKSKWERCPEWKRQDLNCYWDDDKSYLDGEGNLVLETAFDRTNKYLCGAVRSKGKFEQAYGYFEIRCTVNTVPGYWTAFWLMGDSVMDETEGGVNGTEIDIMESAYCNEKLIQNTLNWDGYGEAHKVSGFKAPADVYDGEYHTFSLLWTEDEYVYYIDGVESWRTAAEEAGGVCEVPLYVKVTAETGSWTMPAGGIKGLPDYMKVDYVRVYAAE